MAKQYIPKPTPIDAIMFEGGPDNAADIAEWAHAKGYFLEYKLEMQALSNTKNVYETRTQQVAFLTDENGYGGVRAEPGDWIVFIGDTLSVMTSADFNEKYQEA